MADIQRDWLSSRGAKRADLNLGVIYGGVQAKGKFRTQKLEDLHAYYENRQYAALPNWEKAAEMSMTGDYVAVRKRQPRIRYAYAKSLCSRVAAKLVGDSTFPIFKVEDDPDTEVFLKAVLKLSKLNSKILEAVKETLALGSGFIRFYVIDGILKVESYSTKSCYPVFSPSGSLNSIKIQYVYSDENDKDEKGKPKDKWYKLELTEMSDILYDNPEYVVGQEPVFNVVSSVEHNLGFVQGVWMRTSENKHSPDGYSLIEDILEFIDELNYSLSQSSVAVSYNQDPQLTIKGMDVDEIDNLIRSSSRAWDLGRDGEGKFLESNLGGVKTASELRDKVKVNIQDISRIVLLDPEKIVGSAQSAKAMEVLHGPLVELVNELRPMVEAAITELLLKMALTLLILNGSGADVGIEIPPGYKPKSLNITTQWPPIFPMTMADLREKLSIAVQASAGNLFSRETMTRWMAKDFDVENVEEELAKIAAQPIINPFGGGF